MAKNKSSLEGKKIGFIGVGNMGCALVRGLIDAKKVKAADICLSDVMAEKMEPFKKAGARIVKENGELARTSDVIILAVKPQNMDSVLSEISGALRKDSLVISIAAGVPLSKIEKYLTENPVIRVMPNMAALVKSAITALTAGKLAQDKDMETAKEIFGAVGDAIVVEEKMMNAVTALSGSGPAYLFYFLECMIGGGLKLGFSQVEAEKFGFDTVRGAIKLIEESHESPEALRRKVTSPGGTTEAAIKYLEEKGFREIFTTAVIKASERAEELSKK